MASQEQAWGQCVPDRDLEEMRRGRGDLLEIPI